MAMGTKRTPLPLWIDSESVVKGPGHHSGSGLHTLTRSQYRALGVFNELGETLRAKATLNLMSVGMEDRMIALNIHRLVKK